LNHIQEALEHDFELIQTTDDNEACRWANQERFDLAVIDHRLARGISGLEVLSRMRMAHPLLRGVILIDYPEYKPLLDVRSAIAYFWKRDLHSLAATIHRFVAHPIERRRVFLSYAREDRERVLEIHAELVSQGYLPWMDVKSIIPGKEWEPEIDAAIEDAHFFVYCLTRHSLIQEGAIVRELRRALKKQEGLRSRFIITARLDEVGDALLSKFHWADLFLPDGMSQLLAALSASDAPLKPPAPPPVPSSADAAPPEPHSLSGWLKDLIARGESAELEFKSSLRWDFRQQKANKELEATIIKTISAFLNMQQGGVLLVGVKDDGTILGLEYDYQTLKGKNRDGFERHTYELLIDAYGSAVATLVRLEFEAVEGKDVCRITAEPSHKPVYLEGRLYIRTGNSTRELSAKDAIEYSRSRWKT
jgi:CheY-like chemotaxis protein